MDKNKKIRLNIRKLYYDVLSSKDGKSYEIDEEQKNNPMYQIQLDKNYYNINNRIDLIRAIKNDFQSIFYILDKMEEEELDRINEENQSNEK